MTASALAVKKAYAFLHDRVLEKLSDQRIGELLIEAARISHHAVRSGAQEFDASENMITTLISPVISGTKAFIGHRGGSRAYRWSGMQVQSYNLTASLQY